LLLQLWGHEVRVAYDGPSALTAAAALRPEIVLLDLTLPDMDGYEVADRLRQGHIGEARLVAITGRGLEADRQRSRAAGFDGHLVKPVEPAALRALFEQWSRSLKTG
jgi:CheY-like chemotaxis protein